MFFIAFATLFAVATAVAPSGQFGFGAQKLKNFDSKAAIFHQTLRHGLQAYSCDNITEHFYADAVIDNFAPIEKQVKWQGRGQRYFLNRQFWGGENYPIFVFIGGEGEEKCTRLTSYMYMFNLAQEHQALMVDVEHRFYGQSLPLPDASPSSLQFLSSSQALADLQRVITSIKESLHSQRSKVITVGGSYPGNLAAWFRLKFPQASVGSIASSAPLLAQLNFPEYMEVVAQALVHYSGEKCYTAFKTASDIVGNLLLQGAGSGGWAKVQADFELCGPMQTDLDVSILLSDLMGNVQGTVQYNNEHSGVLNVTDICATMTQSTEASDVNDAYYNNFVALQKMYRASNGQSCEDASWKDSMQALGQTSAGRSWTYQTCNEFGYFQTADSPNQPFYSWEKWLDLGFYRKICYDAFAGWKSDPQTKWMNENYGALDIAATNVLFPSGSTDPWHALGVSNTTAPLPAGFNEQKVFIANTAHCNDLYAPAPSDPPALTYAREVIADQVKKWLA